VKLSGGGLIRDDSVKICVSCDKTQRHPVLMRPTRPVERSGAAYDGRTCSRRRARVVERNDGNIAVSRWKNHKNEDQSS
jgi:hypothetical protein